MSDDKDEYGNTERDFDESEDVMVLTTVPRRCSGCGGRIPPGPMLVPRVGGRLRLRRAVHASKGD